ncbi:hypothetical protein PLICRDRAFT_54238 [Plicaturopsis crispa FD-325 SS-3]|nr:hypothetical protein PLICRDRAFT_54238 [Plicaturopsis crispa FD-325 SS-3]
MSAVAFERQIRPIYDALDTGSNKSAIVSCNKLLKKHPKNGLVKALKSLALVRSQKVEESLVLCDEVLASKTTDDATLSAMMHVLRALGRHADMITMFEDAFKQQPENEELGTQTFFANVRTGNWKVAQQIATRMHKQFREDRYLFWAIISAVLQANDPSTPPPMRTLLYKLAHRLVASSPTPSYVSPDRFHLHLTILRELQLFDEANTLLESEIGKAICSKSLVCDEIRREIWRMRGLWIEEGVHAEQRIVEQKDRNWLEFISVLDATFSYVLDRPVADLDESTKSEFLAHVSRTKDLFTRVAVEDGVRDRSGLLGLLELERRLKLHGVSEDSTALVEMMENYFQQIGDKTCCFEDLRPYLSLDADGLSRWTSFLESQNASTISTDIRRAINIQKLLRYNLSEAESTPDAELVRAQEYLTRYIAGLELGKDLPGTELQPADDFAILAAQALVSAWHATKDEAHLFKAVTVLEFAATKSIHSYQIRLLLVRIYRLLGAPSQALDHYRLLDVKQVQNDTLSHFILSRASTFSLAATGDLTLPTECLESSQVYMTNSQETADYIVRAFTSEKYSQIPDFINFEDRLDNSLQRDAVKVEHVRMRLAHEPVNTDLVDMELIELKFIFDRFHHDNRDFDILPNYQPRWQKSFNEQTLLFENSPGLGWLWVFLKLYIRAFQHASDLDDTVEDKLLVGDRPKQSNDPENQLPLKERLIKRKQEELDELTPDELSFLNYATALADWLEPYHDHIRPPPSVVLAEAAKQTELKTGLPLRGVTIPPSNGSTSPVKKDEEAPPVKPAPELVSAFFDQINGRFREALARKVPAEILHVATLAQEALLLFTVETIRFKPASIVKIHKLGTLVQNFKVLRAQAITVLQEISTEIVKFGEQEGTADARKVFVQASKPVTSEAIDHDFVLNVAKKVTDSRKKVLEGVGKGIAKVCSNYSAA